MCAHVSLFDVLPTPHSSRNYKTLEYEIIIKKMIWMQLMIRLQPNVIISNEVDDYGLLQAQSMFSQNVPI